MSTHLTAFTALLSLSTVLCAGSLNNILFNGDYEFVDLTYTFDENTVYWPDGRNFGFIKKIEEPGANHSWYASYEFAAGEHGGTHLDAPYHFNKSGLHVSELPIEKLIVPLVVVDVSSQVNDDPNFVLTRQHLDYLLPVNHDKPCLIIFKFGWGKYFHDRQKYLGINEETNTLNFPGLSGEIAEWITTAYKNVVGVGVDVASMDPGSSTEYPVHTTFARAGLFNIENVNIARPISSYKCTALVLPMKIADGTGAPLRLVAICPKECH